MSLPSHDIDFLCFMKIRKRDATRRSGGVLCFYEGYHKSGVLHRHLLTKSRKDKKRSFANAFDANVLSGTASGSS